MSGTASDSDAETVITEGTTDGGKVNKEKGKVSQTTDVHTFRSILESPRQRYGQNQPAQTFLFTN